MHLRGAFVAVLFSAAVTLAAASPAQPECAKPNRLIDSGSPYLLQHACNPVDWHPWGAEAVDKARRENKPVFISVGYSTCYWCHVANRTLFQNPAIAALLNAHFVAVKVDREQRPDLDRLFMTATRTIMGSAGWPNNLFLTPGLEPFFAGSYFPPDDDEFGRPGFITVLTRIRDDWRQRRERVEAQGRRIAARMHELARPAAAAVSPKDWRKKALGAIAPGFDRKHGGMLSAGGAKFPQPIVLDYLLAEHAAKPDPAMHGIVIQALGAMAAGGIRDHLGGGFHRYAVEPSWSVPHFEKMLYDNAQLLALYALAHRLDGKPAWRSIALEIATHLARDMQAAEGGFFTALDSGVGGEEGMPYLWRREEIEAVLGADRSARFLKHYEIKMVAPGEFSDALAEAAGVLRRRESAGRDPADRRADLAMLFSARQQRPQPARDEKQVVALNGLAIAALASSAHTLRAPAQRDQARRAAERFWSLAWTARGGSLAHELYRGRAQGEGLLEDYAHLARGFLALSDAGAGEVWRQRARLLIEAALGKFRRPDGRLAASSEALRLPIPLDDAEDYAYPSGTSAAIEVMLRLGGDDLLAAAGKAIVAAGGQVGASPAAWPALLAVLAGEERNVRRALELAQAGAKVSPRDTASDSARHVGVAARLRPAAGAVLLELTLRIDAGWHVNANPASFDYLVPTRLLIEGAVPRRIAYPPGKSFRARFAPEAIQVYEGEVTILAEFAPGAVSRLRARLSVQACNEEVCLAPSTLAVPLR